MGGSLEQAIECNSIVFPNTGGRIFFKDVGSILFTPAGADAIQIVSGGSLNFADDVVLTHSAGTLTFESGALVLGSNPVTVNGHAVAVSSYHNVSLAEMNTGHTLLAAVTGLKYRLINCISVARGHNLAATAAATGFALYGTQAAASVALHTVLVAAALADTAVPIGVANTSIVETSFEACDAASAITCKAVSAGAFDLITSHSIDLVLTYALEA